MKGSRITAFAACWGAALLVPGQNARASSFVHPQCEITRPVGVSQGLDGLVASTKAIASNTPPDIALRSSKAALLAEVATIKKDNARLSAWETDAGLRTAIAHLVDQANLSLLPRKEASARVAKKRPLQSSLVHLLRAYGTLEQRDANRDAYLDAIRATLARTETGKRIDRCFESATSAMVSDDIIVWLDQARKDLHLNPNLKAGFFPLENPAGSGHFMKTTLVSVYAPPIELLLEYAHERKHGCNALETAELARRNRDLEASPESRANSDRVRAADELRAYSTEIELFSELSKAAPKIVCNSVISGGALYGRQISSLGRYFSDIEEKMSAGVWPEFLFEKMVEAGLFQEQSIFKPSGVKAASAHHELLPELQEVLKRQSNQRS